MDKLNKRVCQFNALYKQMYAMNKWSLSNTPKGYIHLLTDEISHGGEALHLEDVSRIAFQFQEPPTFNLTICCNILYSNSEFLSRGEK